jgi:hypothetical protein
MCRELNEFWNCNTGYGTLGYRTFSAKKNSCDKWLCKITWTVPSSSDISTVLISILVTEWLAKIRDTKNKLKINNLTSRIHAICKFTLCSFLIWLNTLKPEEEGSTFLRNTLVNHYQKTQHHIPKDTVFIINIMGTSDPIHYRSLVIFTSAVQSAGCSISQLTAAHFVGSHILDN